MSKTFLDEIKGKIGVSLQDVVDEQDVVKNSGYLDSQGRPRTTIISTPTSAPSAIDLTMLAGNAKPANTYQDNGIWGTSYSTIGPDELSIKLPEATFRQLSNLDKTLTNPMKIIDILCLLCGAADKMEKLSAKFDLLEAKLGDLSITNPEFALFKTDRDSL